MDEDSAVLAPCVFCLVLPLWYRPFGIAPLSSVWYCPFGIVPLVLPLLVLPLWYRPFADKPDRAEHRLRPMSVLSIWCTD